MIEKLLTFTKGITSKEFIKNFISLTIFQVFELFIPIITIPLIIAKVGAEKYGLISFSLIFCIFFQLIIDFGFNTISVRDISVNKNDKFKILEIFSFTTYSKLIIIFLCFILFLPLILVFEKFNSQLQLYIYTFVALSLQSLSPIWFFQGLQDSKYITISSFIGRISYLILILFFVENSQDFILIPVFNAVGFFLTLLLLLFFARKYYNVKLQKIKVVDFCNQLKKGKFMFLSEVKLYFLSYFNIFLLGIISGNLAVAYFVGAEKIIRAFSTLMVPIQNSLFPILSVKLEENKSEAKILIYKILKIAIVILLTTSFVLFFLSEKIIISFLGETMENSVIVFKILILVPLLSFLDSFFGKQILLNLNKENDFFKVVLIIAGINIPLIYFFIINLSYVGAAISQVITQTLLVIGMYYYSKKALLER